MSCSSTPLIYNLPPKEAQPFFTGGLRPLRLPPPVCAKLAASPRRRYRKSFPRDFTTKNTQGPASMKFRGHDQHATAILTRKTFFYVSRLIACRHSLDHANADRFSLWKVLNVFLRQLPLSKFISSCGCSNIEQFPAAIALFQQLQRPRGTAIRLPPKHHNHAERLGSIDDQQSAGIGAKATRNCHHNSNP